MLKRISHSLDASGNEHEDQRRFYLVFLSAALTILLATWPREPLGDVAFFGFIALLSTSLVFTYRGQLWLASVIMPVAGFLLITQLVYAGGINDEAVGGYYFILIVAGLMIGRRALLFFGALCTLAVLAIGFGEVNGWILNHYGLHPNARAVETAAAFLLATTFGLNYMVMRLDKALKKAQQSADAQVQANLDLRLLEVALEKRIEDRTAELDFSTKQLMEQFERINSLQAKLRDEAIRDPLTGLFNRRHLDEFLPIELARSKRAAAPLTVLMLDIDRFKNINDTHGHPIGDIVLQSVAETLKTNVRIGDIVCRYGGEEFTLVFPGMQASDGLARADKLRSMIESQSIDTKDGSISVTISIGGSVYPNDATTDTDLIALADSALYRAKQNGRNRVEFSVK
jgi:diguanylate cyclase (GGDEF)-like protein